MTDLCPRCRTWCYGDCGYDAPRRPAGPAVSVRQDRTQLVVSSPYDASFVAGVKKLGSRWSPGDQVWTVPLAERAALRELLVRVYRTDGGIPAPAPGPRPGGRRVPTGDDVDKILDSICVPAEGTP